MGNGVGLVLVLIVALLSSAYPFPALVQAAASTTRGAAVVASTRLHAQWCEQDLQDWKTRRDVVDYQIAEIDTRLKESKLTEAERKALEDQKGKLMQERTNIDWWIKWIFERLIRGACGTWHILPEKSKIV